MSADQNAEQIFANAEKILKRAWTHKKIALAVSGGPDSIALMHHVARQIADEPDQDYPEVTVLTVDHGLREEAADEARFVEQQAKILGLNTVTLRWEGEKPTSNIQEEARDARYDLMLAYCTEHKITAFLTAHHQDDQAETMLMRLCRGSGLDGLSAMPQVAKRSSIEILRPFLDIPKQSLQSFLTQAGAKWVEDPSNLNTDFERVRVRSLLGQLGELGLEPDQLSLSAKRLNRARIALDNAAMAFLATSATLHDAGYCEIDFKNFLRQDEEIAIRAVTTILKSVGAPQRPPRLAKVEELYEALASRQRAAATLARCRLDLCGDTLLITRELRDCERAALFLQPGATETWDRRFILHASNEMPRPVTVRFLQESGLVNLKQLDKDRTRIKGMSDIAASSCVSFWSDDALLFVPHLGFDTENWSKYISTDYLHSWT